MPDVLRVLTDFLSPAHHELCDAVLRQAGYRVVGGVLYEVVTWVEVGDGVYRWTLQRVHGAAQA